MIHQRNHGIVTINYLMEIRCPSEMGTAVLQVPFQHPLLDQEAEAEAETRPHVAGRNLQENPYHLVMSQMAGWKIP